MQWYHLSISCSHNKTIKLLIELLISLLQNTFTGTFCFVEILDNVFNSVIRWHLASIGYPACIRDPASVRTSDLDPQLVLETGLIFETRLLLDVLR